MGCGSFLILVEGELMTDFGEVELRIFDKIRPDFVNFIVNF